MGFSGLFLRFGLWAPGPFVGFWASFQPFLGQGFLLRFLKASGPLLVGFWASFQCLLWLRASSQLFLALKAFSGPFVGFGPLSSLFLPSLFWLRGPFLGLFPAFSGLGAFSGAFGGSGPLPSLFWPSGAFSGLLGFFPAFFLLLVRFCGF